MSEQFVRRLANDLGGTIDEVGELPDGSGFATMSFPLPKDHWLTAEGYDEPPAYPAQLSMPPLYGIRILRVAYQSPHRSNVRAGSQVR